MRGRFDEMIAESLVEARGFLLRPMENILTQKSLAPSLLHDVKESAVQSF
jgi:hypothetical protein